MSNDGMTVITDPRQMAIAQLLRLRGALKLEILGLKRSRGRSAYAILRSLGLRGSRESVYTQLTDMIENRSVEAITEMNRIIDEMESDNRQLMTDVRKEQQ